MKAFLKTSMMFLIILLIFLKSNAISLDKETHEFLNEKIVGQSLLDSYLIANLGFKDGVKEQFEGKQVLKWIAEGGGYEDVPPWTIIPYLRSVNHFHNPLKLWNEAGLNDVMKGISLVIWAQDQSSAGIILGGDWSWKKARDSFYKGLTGTTKTEREKNLADTFRALGQVMHLVQDASVPAHVRNDSHIWGEGYEEWAGKYVASLDISSLTFDSSILSETPNPLAPMPIAKIFDTDRYAEGINPSTSLTWGISEYTNSNFASHDTIFTENFNPSHRHYFPYPRYNACYELYETTLPSNKKRLYLRKKCDGETVEHFATAGPLFKHLSFDHVLQRDELKLDGKCHEDYASKLIPRAVGYSAGLLNYFFRGEIDMISDNAAGTGYVIVNNTDENMSGTFELWYDSKNNTRVKLRSWSLSIDKKSSGNNKSTNISFIPPSDAKELCKFILVFKGQMGYEQNMVIGKVLNSVCP